MEKFIVTADTTEDEYAKMIDELEDLWFIADMSDDYCRTLSEQAHIREVYKDIYDQAVKNGLSGEYHRRRWERS